MEPSIFHKKNYTTLHYSSQFLFLGLKLSLERIYFY